VGKPLDLIVAESFETVLVDLRAAWSLRASGRRQAQASNAIESMATASLVTLLGIVKEYNDGPDALSFLEPIRAVALAIGTNMDYRQFPLAGKHLVALELEIARLERLRDARDPDSTHFGDTAPLETVPEER